MRNDRRLVLMVEDDNKLREVLTKFLSRNDYVDSKGIRRRPA